MIGLDRSARTRTAPRSRRLGSACDRARYHLEETAARSESDMGDRARCGRRPPECGTSNALGRIDSTLSQNDAARDVSANGCRR